MVRPGPLTCAVLLVCSLLLVPMDKDKLDDLQDSLRNLSDRVQQSSIVAGPKQDPHYLNACAMVLVTINGLTGIHFWSTAGQEPR
ncbi:hypothetical protein Ancab_026031 [Ancistrocladus abbreviatus]